MTREDLEFQISQYVDGTLSTSQRSALEARIATDPQAQTLLAEFQKLQSHLTNAMPLPGIHWDQLALTISESLPQREVAGRIGWAWTSRLAIAASILLAITIGTLLSVRTRSTPTVMSQQAVAIIEGPQAETAAGPVIEQITVGPSAALAARADSWRYAEGVVTRPSHIELAGAIPPAGESHVH